MRRRRPALHRPTPELNDARTPAPDPLPDSGRIQEDDAETANKYGFSRHKPAQPLYTEEDARAALPSLRPVGFGKPHRLGDELAFTLSRSGHILGSSFIQVISGS